jgi:RNase P protein component
VAGRDATGKAADDAGGVLRWRSGRHYLAVQARITSSAGAGRATGDAATGGVAGVRSPVMPVLPDAAVRFGFTVGKRNCRRAVDRAAVKRVLRESARALAAGLDAAAGERRVDVVVRLKAPVPDRASLPRPQLKKLIRAEADSLLAQLAGALQKGAA